MKQKSLALLVGIVIVSFLTTSCSFMKIGKEVTIPLVPGNISVSKIFNDLDKDISATVRTSVPGNYPTIDFPSLSNKIQQLRPKLEFSQTITEFASAATTDYMQKLGFDVAPFGSYQLEIDINEFNLTYTTLNSIGETVVYMTYRLVDNAGQAVIPATSVKVSEDGKHSVGEVYCKALDQINWNRIAKYLTVAKTAAEEKNSKVKGIGDTALEHSVIRWYITSSPQGADVTWRVVSSTPDVANTNSNYIGTTPYESTESFDIRGLTYNNSGNVQIEVSCEKSGYMTQRKRFNLRQVIDQKEISAKFNLIKDE